MTYSLVVPPELVTELYFIREKTKVSIRKQILQSVESHIKDYKSKGDENGILQN